MTRTLASIVMGLVAGALWLLWNFEHEHTTIRAPWTGITPRRFRARVRGRRSARARLACVDDWDRRCGRDRSPRCSGLGPRTCYSIPARGRLRPRMHLTGSCRGHRRRGRRRACSRRDSAPQGGRPRQSSRLAHRGRVERVHHRHSLHSVTRRGDHSGRIGPGRARIVGGVPDDVRVDANFAEAGGTSRPHSKGCWSGRHTAPASGSSCWTR
jgi:hypothetical protein